MRHWYRHDTIQDRTSRSMAIRDCSHFFLLLLLLRAFLFLPVFLLTNSIYAMTYIYFWQITKEQNRQRASQLIFHYFILFLSPVTFPLKRNECARNFIMNIASFFKYFYYCFTLERLENRREMTKQGVEKEEEGTCIQAVFASQTMQRCANKLAERRGKQNWRRSEEERKRERENDREVEK